MHTRSIATLTFAITLLVVQIAGAQEDDGRNVVLGLLARPSADSIVLRWGVSTPRGWSAANTQGYILERVRMTADGTFDQEGFVLLTSEPIRPWTLQMFRDRVTEEHPFAAVAAQMLYGKGVASNDPSDEIGAMQDGANIFENRFGIALFAADNDAIAAEGLGLRFVDRTVRTGERYVYRLRVAPAPAESEQLRFDTAGVVVQAVATDPPLPPFDVRAEGKDRHIEVSWGREVGRSYSGYYIERSDDNGITWHRLNRTPFVVMRSANSSTMRPAYTDTSIVNDRNYRYRVLGVTPFGDLSSAAEVEAHGRDLTPPSSPMQSNPRQIGPRSVKVTWRMENGPDDLVGFVVARTDSSTAFPHPLHQRTLPPSTREFIDTAATEDEPWYIVLAVDTAGNVSKSFAGYAALVDTTPPARPTGLVGTIDTSGIVHLRWNMGSERSLMGYRILWANDPSHEFSLLTPNPVFDTLYVDTITVRTLSRKIYYRVVAESDRYIRSAPSENLELTRPDVVAPVAAIITSVSAGESGVTIRFVPSSSEDLAAQIVERRRNGEREWTLIARIPAGVDRYEDTTAGSRATCEYRVVAIDSAGHRSEPSNSVQGRRYDNGRRAPVTSLRASYDAGRKSVVLHWNHDGAPTETFQYVLYRARDNGPMTRYEGVAGEARDFEDRLLVGEGRYTYAIRVLTDSGAESPLSDRAQVDVVEAGR